MRILIFFIAFFISLMGFSQFENSKKGVRFAPIKKKEAPLKPLVKKSDVPIEIKYESSLDKKKGDNVLNDFSILPKKVEKGIMDTSDPTIRNSSEIYTDKLNKKLSSEGISQEILNSDLFLGEFIVYTTDLDAACRDYSAIDGDDVRIWVNGEIAVREVNLEADFKRYHLILKEGLNIIQIEALNIGLSFPNTGQFNFFDGNGRLVTNQNWGLNAGYKAVIRIIKLKGIAEKASDNK